MVPSTKICRHCRKEFSKPLLCSRKRWEKRFCCSKSCGDASKKTPWLRKFEIKKGESLSPETQYKKGHGIGENNRNWKGDDVGYYALHTWCQRQYGTPSFCEHCKSSARGKYDWANISGEYKRDRSDWLRLCRSCHSKYDNAKRKERRNKRTEDADGVMETAI